MKKIFILSFIIGALLSSTKLFADNPENYPEDYYADSCYYDVYFNQVDENYNPESEPAEESNKQKRTPSQRIYGSISKTEGLRINNVNISDIYAFEIYDTDGVCIGIFCDADDFVQAVFSYKDNMEIRLRTQDFTLLGYL